MNIEKESDLQKAIIQLITMKGGVATRVNSGAVVKEDPRNGKSYVIKGAAKGTADVIACYRGHYIAVECKVGNNKMTPSQEEFRRLVIQANGIHICAYSQDQVIMILELIDQNYAE